MPILHPWILNSICEYYLSGGTISTDDIIVAFDFFVFCFYPLKGINIIIISIEEMEKIIIFIIKLNLDSRIYLIESIKE